MASVEAALAYARAGYAIFPCEGKRPLTPHGFHDATTNESQILAWWGQYPDANIGLSAAGLVVIDVDCRNGEGPPEDLTARLDAARTPVAQTPNGGRHYYFRRPPGYRWRPRPLRDHVDVRTDGSYVIAPPSRGYAWLVPLDVGVPDPPLWLINLLEEHSRPQPALAEAEIIPEGRRNETLTRVAGSLRRVGFTEEEIFHALSSVNVHRCRPLLPMHELRQIARSVSTYVPDPDAEARAFKSTRPEPLRELPEEVFQVPGFIGEIINYAVSTAPYPSRPLALAGAIALQATLAGRKVRDEMNNRTNVYILALASSGTGKEHIRKINKDVLSSINSLSTLVESVASGEAIEDQLRRQPSSLCQLDEMDAIIRAISKQQAASSIAGIGDILTKLYSSSSSTYRTRIRAQREGEIINNPCLCVFGTAVPDAFYGSLSAHLLQNGFLARFIIIHVGARGHGQQVPQHLLPQTILQTARYWSQLSPGGNLDALRPQPIVVAPTAEAREELTRFQRQQEDLYDSADSDTAKSVYARTVEQARRLALIYACSECPEQPTITLNAVRWARTLADYSARYTLALVDRYVATSEFDRRCQQTLNTLEAANRWVPRTDLLRKLRIKTKELDEIYETLYARGLVEVRTVSSGGRPVTCYRLMRD